MAENTSDHLKFCRLWKDLKCSFYFYLNFFSLSSMPHRLNADSLLNTGTTAETYLNSVETEIKTSEAFVAQDLPASAEK